MKKIMFGVLAILLCVMTGCKSSAGLAGSDRDKHGCIGSAGYVWSSVQKDCIRLFEKGIRLNDKIDIYSSFAAYLVFNADSSSVEVFLPKDKSPDILVKHTFADGNIVWKKERDAHRVIVRKVGDLWTIVQKGKETFQQK